MRLVFCGTPRFAVPTLEALHGAGHEIALVVTQPDRPVGRSQELAAPPVKQTALAAGIPVTQPEKIRNNAEFRAQLESIAPDAIIVVAYGRIIPPWMLALPRLGCINLHASLLPKYRGAAPIQWAVAMGEDVTGNTTMLLEEGLDTGPILMQRALIIRPEQTAVDLFEEMAIGGAPLVVETLEGLANGTSEAQAAGSRAGHAGAAAGTRRWADELCRAHSHHDQESLARLSALAGCVHRARRQKADRAQDGRGERCGNRCDCVRSNRDRWSMRDERIFVACAGNTWLELLELQLEGKKRLRGRGIPARDAARPGMRLG